ncbi:MAG: hypothetical protein JXA69_08420 [Phycisphaerae bacterium]|nr:hypothetical protein [Phycisphaerae bacterium]
MTTGRRLGIEATCGLLLLVAAAPITFGATRTFDFNNAPASYDPYGWPDADEPNRTAPPIFNMPWYSTQTRVFIGADGTGFGHGGEPGDNGNDTFLTHWYYYAPTAETDNNSQEIRFSWADKTDDASWVRIITAEASGVTPIFPNPTVDIGDGSSIKMKFLVYLMKDDGVGGMVENTTGQIEVALILRETGENLPLGEDGRADVGNLEFVGVDASSTQGTSSPYTPIGGVALTSSGGALTDFQGFAWYDVEWTFGSDNTKVTVTVDGGTPQTLDIAGCINGDGILSAADDRCTLAGLAIRKPASDDETMKIFVDIDDVVIDAPGITDPVYIHRPILETMTEVKVSYINPIAENIKLYKDTGSGPVLEQTVLSTDPGADFASGEHLFTGLSLVAGDKLSATQTIGGIESGQSGVVTVLSAAVWTDSFDTYATQAEFAAAWPDSGNGWTVGPMDLSTTHLHTCENAVIEPGVTTGVPQRRYHDLGYGSEGINGSDDVPLWFTFYYYYDNTNGNQRNYVELRWQQGGVWAPGTSFTKMYAFGTYNAAPAGYYWVRDYGGGGAGWMVTTAARKPGQWVKMQVKITTSTVTFYVDDVQAKQLARIGTATGITHIVIGSALTNGGVPAWWDSFSLSLGDNPIDPFGTPPPPQVNVQGPLPAGAETVTVTSVNTAPGTEVFVYADGAPIGSAAGNGSATVVVPVSPALTTGQSIQAVQELADETRSCFSNPVVVDACSPVPSVTVTGPLSAGSTTVTVTGVRTASPAATLVTVYANDVEIGTAVPESGTVAVTVDPVLVKSQAIKATQTINTIEGCLPSVGRIVGSGDNAGLLLTLGIRDTGATSGIIGDNGGSSGPIEWIFAAGSVGGIISNAPQGLLVSPSDDWQTITFDPVNDTIVGATGITSAANGVFEGTYGVIENLALVQTSTDTGPYKLYIDNVTNGGTLVEDFEAYDAGQFVMFRQPSFSGTTSAHILTAPNLSVLDADVGDASAKSCRVEWQYIDELNTRWIRLTTYAAPFRPNPLVSLTEPITFRVKLSLAAPQYTLTVEIPGGNGTCSPMSGTYDENTVVPLLASPAEGYQVASWTGTDDDGSTSNSNSVTMTSDKTVTLVFEPTGPTCNDPVQDTDGDGDVDLTDFGVFSQCFNGPNRAYAASLPEVLAKCECLDQDIDNDVDLTDFGVFSSCFNGPNRAPAAGCP